MGVCICKLELPLAPECWGCATGRWWMYMYVTDMYVYMYIYIWVYV